VNITFEEAARGVRKDVRINVIDACGICKGTGVEPGYAKVSPLLLFSCSHLSNNMVKSSLCNFYIIFLTNK
jgi:hypothetical protein